MSELDLFPYPRGRLQEPDLDLAAGLQDLAEKEIVEKRLELKEDYEALLGPAYARLMADMGLQRMFWPEEMGGDGHSGPEAAFTVTAALEQVGRADVGLSFLAAHSFALQASLAADGNRKQEACARFAPLFCANGSPVIVSFLLPVFGEEEDAPAWHGKSYQVKATPTATGWKLSGRRARPTCSGADADLFGAWCAVEGEERPAFILVPGDAKGVSRGPEFKKTGLAASRNADLDLEGVELPAGNCLFREEDEYRRLLSWYYLGVTASAVGALLASYRILREWGDNRVIKGTGNVFKENPLTGALMGEIAKEIAVDRLLAYDLAEMLAEPDTYGDAGSEGVFTAALMIAHQVLASAEHAIHRTMELMASAGYAKEWQLERYWRDVKTLQCYLGAYELAKHDFARWFYGARTL